MMKCVILLFGLFFGVNVFSQSNEDYEDVLKLLVHTYNNNNSLVVYSKFNDDLKGELNEIEFKEEFESLIKDKGKMLSYEFIMEGNNEKHYLVDFDNGAMLLSIQLLSDKKISLFNIKEY